MHTRTESALERRHEKLSCISRKPNLYVLLHFRDRHGAAPLRYRNHALKQMLGETQNWLIPIQVQLIIPGILALRLELVFKRFAKNLSFMSDVNSCQSTQSGINEMFFYIQKCYDTLINAVGIGFHWLYGLES